MLTDKDNGNLQRDTQDVMQNAFYDTNPVAQTLVSLSFSQIEQNDNSSHINSKYIEKLFNGLSYSTGKLKSFGFCKEGV